MLLLPSITTSIPSLLKFCAFSLYTFPLLYYTITTLFTPKKTKTIPSIFEKLLFTLLYIMKNCFSFSLVEILILRCKEATGLWVLSQMGNWVLFKVMMKKAIYALTTCIFALGGAIVGTITGAIKGQTTETGLVRGAGIGAVAGAITAVQLMESMINGESFSKVALLSSLVNGKVFVEWVSPALLKAYQWQVSSIETSSGEISDIFEVSVTRGLSQDYIKKLPKHKIPYTNITGTCHATTCTICLQDLKNGDSARTLPSCRHSFHSQCIDEWLSRQGSCPICRQEL